MNQQIPKRLIQTGKSRQLPLLAQASAANLQLLNPGFEYMFFDDADVEDFIDTHFPQHRSVFNAFPYRIQKYDFFRYLAIYHYGGFYFDLDIMLARGLDDLCDRGCVLPFEELSLHAFLRDAYGMDWEVGNYAFGAAPGHPFIAAVIENCVRAQRDANWPAAMWQSIPRLFRQAFYVLDTTGPGLVSRTLAEFPGAGSTVHVLFPSDVCDEAHWHQFGQYGVHLQEGGWRSRKSVWLRRLEGLWETRVRAAALAKAVERGPLRTLAFCRSG
jgi:inositol phosphorylceramide mannosyltransferase catalytic subunit